MKSRITGSIFIVLSAVVSLCANVKSTTSAFDFMTMQLDARSTGFGGASSLIPAAGTAHWGNPALLAAYGKVSFAASFSPYIAGINYGGGTGSLRLSNGIMIAPTFKYLAVGSIDGYDKYGVELGSEIAPFSIDAGVAVSYKLASVLSAGLTAKVGYENLLKSVDGFDDASAAAMLFDGGIFFQPTRALSLSAGFRNVGFFMERYQNDESDLPSSMYAGIRYGTRGNNKVNALLEIEKQVEFPLTFSPGLEFLLYKEIVSFRIGTNVSTTDMAQFIDVIGGETQTKSEYSKSDAQIIALGAGVKVPLDDKAIFFDMASKIFGDGMGVGFIFTGGFSF